MNSKFWVGEVAIFVWFTTTFPSSITIFLWFSHGFYIFWFSNPFESLFFWGSITIFPLLFLWFPHVVLVQFHQMPMFLWLKHGFPMGFPMVFPWVCYICEAMRLLIAARAEINSKVPFGEMWALFGRYMIYIDIYIYILLSYYNDYHIIMIIILYNIIYDI